MLIYESQLGEGGRAKSLIFIYERQKDLLVVAATPAFLTDFIPCFPSSARQ